MPPKSQDDHQDNTVSRRTYSAKPGDSGENAKPSPSEGGGGDRTDFGAFVSRSVRSSADRFKGVAQDADAGGPTEQQGTTPLPRSSPRRERPSRYWRDSLRENTGEDVTAAGPSNRRFVGRPGDEGGRVPSAGDGGDDGGNGAWWQGLTGSGAGNGPGRSLLALVIVGVLVLLLLIFLLTRLLGGDDQQQVDEPVNTPVPTQEIVPGVDIGGTPAGPTPTEGSVEEPTETSEIRRGGDNQLGGEDQEGTPGAQVEEDGDVAESPLARECSGQCLIRVQADNLSRLMEETGNRPSFAGDEIAWVVATPEQVSLLDADAEIELVQDERETLDLYVVTVPEGEDPALVNGYGDIIDESGPYRLIEFDEIPARVATLANSGYNVTKVAPAPPTEEDGNDELPPLSDASADSLMGQVSSSNITEIIADLQRSGAPDGSNLGTRYYTYPGNQIAADYLYRQLESYGLKVWYEDFLTPEGILLVNVVAEVPGEDDSSVYAVMSHFDSINNSDPSIAPGADDNSSGMAVNLEIARILANYELEHPVRFIFVNAEEVGILGANVWARTANTEGVEVKGVFNIDSVGAERQGRYMIINSDAGSRWMKNLLIETNDAYGLGQIIQSEESTEIVADDNMVRDQGIDAVMIARELYGWTPIHHSVDDVAGKVSIDNVQSMTYLVLLSLVQLVQ
ncbi:MAG TPA: M28 family metallopeptidase [Thermomicrobiales bacterium]|nr:M28 family metallopeptidase [Thermomicrobiales bacterium]